MSKPEKGTAAEILDKLWHARDGVEVKSLVTSLSSDETKELIASIDLADVPLNAFCTESYSFRDLDDRMVAVMHLGYRLLEAGRDADLLALLDKIRAKVAEKLKRGSSARKGPSFQSKDRWLIGEDLMIKMHNLSLELMKKSDSRMHPYAAQLLQTILVDYPERLESRFWLAAALHNIYLENKTPQNKKAALDAIGSFITEAKDKPDYQSNVKALQDLRKASY